MSESKKGGGGVFQTTMNINLVDSLGRTLSQNAQWQPIETAPKDGSIILVFGLNDINIAYWQSIDTQIFTDEFGHELYELTHWMPLPEPPK